MTLSIEDRSAIAEVAARVCFANDHFLAEEWASFFTQDGVMTVGEALRLEGRQAMLGHIRRKREQNVLKRHYITNLVIDGNGDEATMKCYVLAFEAGREPVHAEYMHDMVRIEGRWLIKERRVSVISLG